MHPNRSVVLFLFLCAAPFWAIAQPGSDRNVQSMIEQRIEVIADALEDEELDFTVIFDQLLAYYDRPLNLNKATSEELASLFLLNSDQIAGLRMHIERFGPLLDLNELQAVRGFSPQDIRLIQPFVTIGMQGGAKVIWKDIFREGKHDLMLRTQRVLQDRKGFLENDKGEIPFAGDPWRAFMRYRFQYSNVLSAGFTAEKDPGETWLVNGKPDFFAFHLFARVNRRVKTVALGDYQVQFGQGLVMWSGLGFGKILNVSNAKRNGPGLRPYTSVDENRFLRGGAAEFQAGRWTAMVFGSRKKIDASLTAVVDSTDSEEAIFTALQFSGFHRTESEIANKNSVGESMAGGRIAYKGKKLQTGIGGYYLEYDKPFVRDLQPYQYFDLNARQNAVIGADYAWFYKNTHFFGEAAMSQNGGIAALSGLIAALDPKVSVSVVWRNYAPDYQNLLAAAFGENTRNANEKGVYAGFSIKPNYKWELLGYVDYVRFPWLRYLADGPTTARDFMGQVNYSPKRRHSFYARIRWRERGRNSADESLAIDTPVDQTRMQLRLNADYPVSKSIRLKSRVEVSGYDFESTSERGLMIYQDVAFHPLDSRWSITARYAHFDTPSYDTRIYAFESDVLFAYSIPAYYGRGSRAYLMVQCKLNRQVSLWVRYGNWLYADRTIISSGNNEIQGNTLSELKMQLRYRF